MCVTRSVRRWPGWKLRPRKLAPSPGLCSSGLTASLDGVARGPSPSGRRPLVLLCLGAVPASDCHLSKMAIQVTPHSIFSGSGLQLMDPLFRMICGGEGPMVSEPRLVCLSYSWNGGVLIHFTHLGGPWASHPHQTFVGRQKTEPAALGREVAPRPALLRNSKYDSPCFVWQITTV